MTSVLLVVHPHSREAAELAEKARAWWDARSHEVHIWDASSPELPELDLAISLGGDGTMLRTVQLALASDIPVLGVNLGRMGYLAEVEPAGLEVALERLANGEYLVEERMVLDVRVHTAGSTVLSFLALNEVIVEKTAPGHTIRVAVSVGGRSFLTYVADGVLACTPTGSTAYNLSARGPVLSPRLRGIVLTPIAPHLVFDRSLVLDPDEEVEMALLDGHPAAAVVDGAHVVPLATGDAVTCRGAPERARLVTFGELDFHAVLRSRFGLTDR
ncbi:MAG: NAD(+)/NADH kinase [Acidimicrobiales bacterium]